MNSVLTERRGDVGVITLNRPKALNALNLEMVQGIAAALDRWETDEGVLAVLFAGAGERAFCAGGDLKDFYTARAVDGAYGDISIPETFFAAEYRLNHRIFSYPKPTVAFMDGIVMGGGFGIGGHCRVKIATPRTLFAMPETAIGFFPDVGAIYHLIRAPHHVGKYIALTAGRFGAGDMVYAGLASHYVEDASVDDVIAAVQDGRLDALCSTPPRGALVESAAEIESLFAPRDIQAIIDVLEETGTAFAKQTLETLRARAPMSLAVAAEHYALSVGQGFDAVIAQDFTLAQNFMRAPDIYEGIRAVLIDKDNEPVWAPAELGAIKERDIARYFISPS